MTRPRENGLMKSLASGERLLMDGALGTEIERRGAAVDQLGWSAMAVRDSPQLIRQIHRDYIDAGARLHIVNSFALSIHVLDSIGRAGDFEQLNNRCVKLFDLAAQDAGRDRQSLWAGGSLSTFAAYSDRSRLPAVAQLAHNTRRQAESLYRAGVDFFALEMLFDVETSESMLNAVRHFELPVIAGFTCEYRSVDDEKTLCCRQMGKHLQRFETVFKAFIARQQPSNLIIAIMHADYEASGDALAIVNQYWRGPVAIYPNSGRFENLQLQFDTVGSADEFCAQSTRWLQQGVQIVGGCCGLGPAHIEALGAQMAVLNQ